MRLMSLERESVKAILRKHAGSAAVFAAETRIGKIVYEVANELGLSIPEQLSMIVFDDFEHPELFTTPPTVIVQPVTEIGREAAKLLLSLIDSPSGERNKTVLPVHLIERRSVRPLMANDV